MQSLFQDDVGDLDALMSQMNSRSAPSPAFQGFNVSPAPSALASAAPTPRWTGQSDLMSQRAGRRATVTIVEPDVPSLPTLSRQAPPPPVQLSPPASQVAHSVERRPSLGWLDDDASDTQSPAPSAVPPVAPVHINEAPSPSPPMATVDPALAERERLEREELLLQREELLLLAEIKQCEMDIEAESARAATISIKQDAELTAAETQLQIKQTLVMTTESDCTARLDDALKAHERRKDGLRAQQATELDEANTTFRLSISSRMERSMSLVQQQIDDVAKSLAKLNSQRSLVIGSNPHSASAVSIAVDDATLSLQQKLDLGVELVAGFAAQHLNTIRDHVGDYIRKETTDAAHHVWEHHRRTFTEESSRRRTSFVSFLQTAVSKFTAFMEDRQSARSDHVHKFREVSESMSAALRERWHRRTEERNGALTEAYRNHSASFDAEFNSSIEFLNAKYAAIQKSDESIERQRTDDVLHRQGVECSVSANLHAAEVEALEERHQRLQRQISQLSSDVHHTLSISHEAVHGVLQDIEQLHSQVQSKLRAAQSCTKLLHSDENHLELATEGFSADEREMMLLLREKRAVVEALSAEVKSQWGSLSHQRQQCATLRSKLADAVEDEAAAVHEHRLLQASEYARLDMLRSTWEKEYQQVLGSVTHDAAWSGLLSVAESIVGRVASVQASSTSNRRSLVAQRTLHQREDAARCSEHQTLQDLWVGLYDRLLSLNEKIHSVSAYQTSVGVEAAKLELERMTHDAQRDEFRAKFLSMERASQRVERDSASALAMKQRTEDEVRQVAREHDAIILEQRKLSALQSELLQRQRDVMERKDLLATRAVPVAPHRSPFSDLLLAA